MRPTETKRISLLTTAALASTGYGKSVGVVSSTTVGVGPGVVACAAVCLGACCWVACLVGLVRGAFAASARDGHSRVISFILISGRMFMGVWPRVPRCISARAAMLEPPFAARGRDRYHARSIIEVVTLSETLHDSIRAAAAPRARIAGKRRRGGGRDPRHGGARRPGHRRHRGLRRGARGARPLLAFPLHLAAGHRRGLSVPRGLPADGRESFLGVGAYARSFDRNNGRARRAAVD